MATRHPNSKPRKARAAVGVGTVTTPPLTDLDFLRAALRRQAETLRELEAKEHQARQELNNVKTDLAAVIYSVGGKELLMSELAYGNCRDSIVANRWQIHLAYLNADTYSVRLLDTRTGNYLE